MKTIDAVILRGTIMPWSLLIMLVTWSQHSHGMLRISDGEIMEAVAGGTRKRKYRPPRYAWHREVPLDFLPVAARQQMYQRAGDRMERSHGYDWRYYLAYVLRLPHYQVKSRDVCWEFVDHAIRPWVPINKNPARIVGRHLARALDNAGRRRHNCEYHATPLSRR